MEGARYGAAMLWPRHRFGNPQWTKTIVDGAVVAAGVNTKEGPATIISAYIPQGRRFNVANSFKIFLQQCDNCGIVILGGDFNLHSASKSYREAIEIICVSNGLTKTRDGENDFDTFRESICDALTYNTKKLSSKHTLSSAIKG